LIPRLFGFLFTRPWNNGWGWFGEWPYAHWLIGLCLVPPVLLIGCNLLSITCGQFAARYPRTRRWCESAWVLHFLIIAPTLAAAVLIGQWMCDNSGRWQENGLIHSILWPLLGLSLLFFIQQLVAGFAQCFTRQHKARYWFWFIFLFLGIPVLCGFITAALLYGLVTFGEAGVQYGEKPWRALVWGPPAVMWALASGVVVQIGLMGHDLPDAAREWLGRLRAWMMIYSAGWIAIFGASLYGPYWMAILGGHWGKSSIAAAFTWLATTIGGLLAAKSSKTSGKPKEPDEKSFGGLETLAHIAPYVFVVGFVLLIAFGVHAIVAYTSHGESIAANSPEQLRLTQTTDEILKGQQAPTKDAPLFPALAQMAHSYWQSLHWQEKGQKMQITPVTWIWPWQEYPKNRLWISGLWHLLFLCLAATLLLSWRVDINDFSLHHFYKNRLVRCYLGASNLHRNPNPFTGFDEKDDRDLALFRPSSRVPYCGPFPIINATLNVSSGGNLAWQERKAASYVFTPLYSGYNNECGNQKERLADDAEDQASDMLAYRRTTECAYSGGINIGTAVAISGAAGNPNSGYHTSMPVAFLMTVFNVRLGWWLGNPKYKRASQRSSPYFGLLYTGQELFGLTNANSASVNLSDGGHFENMGIYELVRRRCRYIICCDGEQDDQFTFGGLANAIRKCRTDFGVEIDIDLHHLEPKDNFSQVHCAVGKIYYPERKRDDYGYLLYIKSSLTGDEPSDVLEYHARYPQFPHQTTGDQWFDESQFESYRRLGLHMGDAILASVGVGIRETEEFFRQLEQIWHPPQPAVAKYSASHAKTYADLMNAVRADNELAFLDGELLNGWTELLPVGSDSSALRRTRYHCDALIQLMQQVFHDLNLEDARAWDDPHVSGWITIFKYWVQQNHIRETWSITQGTYSPRFREFYNKVYEISRNKEAKLSVAG
ncbi:MAG: hypothetical protein JO182_23725, partial [Acidobacteriaceae bacterium]|nr:hypothetical protein [Acidobacteriaceae bacterium]